MSRRRIIGAIRKYHKWPSLVLSIFTLVFAASGIIMNHRDLFSGIDVQRNFLHKEYRYNNWNNASVRSACRISPDSILIYGNIGVWLTDSTFSLFVDFNRGFPKGIDNRKISRLYLSKKGHLYAGTLFGLYHYNFDEKMWKSMDIEVSDPQVTDIAGKDDSLLVLTRYYLLIAPDAPGNMDFTCKTLPAPEGYDNSESLFKTLWVIHSGKIAGFAGQLFVDLTGLVFIFLTLTGMIYWLFPKWIRKRKQREKKVTNIVRANRFSLKYHNKAGVWMLAFLLITTLSGMFLRPPLLISIANATIGKIPFTLLDSPNPWYDKLRRIIYDENNHVYLIGTNQGVFISGSDLNRPLEKPWPQPPVSIMGINVFEKTEKEQYLIGSFNGLFLWNPFKDLLIDLNDPNAAIIPETNGSPLSEHMTAGYIGMGDRQYIFDYNHGVTTFGNSYTFPEMPEEIIKCPMSLWNLALEFHTGRYYSFLFGKLYILFIPLYGISMIVVLITGFWLWWKMYRK
ncbi:MAG: PepSY domain-containing protein [Bacteroidales bacterium]|nr:PepSY domain-containing protein [Bacteroidales bacterium]